MPRPDPIALQRNEPPAAPHRRHGSAATIRPMPLHFESDTEADEVDAANVARAIQLSLQPASLMTTEVLSQKAEEEELPVTCPICWDKCPANYMTRVSYCCTHKYCKECVLGMFKNRQTPIVECPECTRTHRANIIHRPFIPRAAEGLIDPHFVHGIEGMSKQLTSGIQIKQFIVPGHISSASISCPECKNLIPSVIHGRTARCWRNDCGLVFCIFCYKAQHDDMCIVDKTAMQDTTFVRSQSKACPKCQTPIVHFRNHGCHRVKCSTCSYEFCCICTAQVINDEPNDELAARNTCHCRLFCASDGSCGCALCDECKPGKPCPACNGQCNVCLNVPS